nr:NAD-dependent succinate-semialdehyde dehydrogenase [Pigmentiphaga humi]
MYIDGEWIGREGRDTQPVVDPATGGVLAHLPLARAEDLDRALAAAERAFESWAATPAFERGRILRRAAGLIRERAEDIARTMTREQGKPLKESRIEAVFAADLIDWMAEECRRAYGRVIPARQPGWRWTAQLEPVGVVAAFSPWNFPGTSPARKMAGPLAAGCACILKAAEETPGTAIALTRALHDAGLPPGVFNLVFGVPDQVSRHLIQSPIVKKVTFTGSTSVGKLLAAQAAAHGKPSTMELGGHAPVLVFDDADVQQAANLTAAAKFRNAGQVCVSPSRIFVQRPVYRKFLACMIDLADSQRVGNGLDEGTTMGPLANPRRLAAMHELLDDARARGASVHCGGPGEGPGLFWRPTVVSDLPEHARLLSEEPFGPIASIIPFDTEDEAVRRANMLNYGLAAYLLTADGDRIVRVSNRLRAGLVGVNTFALNGPETPWGGVGDSGYGREGGVEGLQGYLTTKFISQAPLAAG